MTLTVTDLAVARGGVPLMAGVTFAVRPGQALVLRGPNGSGKTTLLRTLAGLQPPLAGAIEGGGERIAYAAHADGLKAALSVAENLAFWASVFGQREIAPALAAFDLEPLAARRAGQLSAGQKRRLGLARLMVTGRDIWVLDEPTVSLDTASVARFAQAVQKHLDRGGMAVMATHIDLGFKADLLEVAQFHAAAAQLVQADEVFL